MNVSKSSGEAARTRFRLYVAGDSPNSLQAITNFHQIALRYFSGYELDLIDVLEDPQRAREDEVLVTPMLVRVDEPQARVVGNLSDTGAVLAALGRPEAGGEGAPSPPSPAEEARALIERLVETEQRLEGLIAGQADAIMSAAGGGPLLLREAQTALQQSRAHYRRLAHHDPLTGLANRLLFMSRLEHAIAHAKRHGSRVALLYLDVDRFKEINDRYGHAAGDYLLRAVSRTLDQCVRAVDTVARMGGDEFAILLEEVKSPHDAERLANKIIGTLEKQSFAFQSESFEASTTVGIGLFPGDAKDGDGLLRAADEAMYRAKEKGRGSYEFFNLETRAGRVRAGRLEKELAGAAERNELELHYQPELDFASGRISGMEALLRWRHPERGLLHPEEFLPLAEKAGLGKTIEQWVFRTLCEQAKAWREEGVPATRLALNLTERQVADKETGEDFRRLLAACGLRPGEIEFEVEFPEGLVVLAAHYAQTFEELSALGFRVALDDCGRERLVLPSIAALPLDRLKISRALIAGLERDPLNRSMVKALIAAARALGLRTLAAGVEDEAQARLLQAQQCDEAQGFLFGPPLPADEAKRLLTGQLQGPEPPVPSQGG